MVRAVGRGRSARLVLVGVVLAWLLASFFASAASAAPPCWKTLLNDWYDGRIDGAYQVHCYTQAIDHLPKDLQSYRQVRSDITRTLQDGIVAMSYNGRAPGPDNVIPGSLPRSDVHSRADVVRLVLAGVLVLMLAARSVDAYRRRITSR